jgi:probable non-F420 flavinoid oxidoreductase
MREVGSGRKRCEPGRRRKAFRAVAVAPPSAFGAHATSPPRNSSAKLITRTIRKRRVLAREPPYSSHMRIAARRFNVPASPLEMVHRKDFDLELGYHASHEQFAPSELLRCVRGAERAGLRHAMCSDHFSPFSEEQGHSGFAWAWLGAALQATNLTFGTVSAPGQRYHPAILAQAAATLSELYPARFWLALGSGENLNEHITGDAWPRKDVRVRRLRECVAIMRALFAGETVSHDGLVRVSEARLYTRPDQPPPLMGAAVSAASAASVAAWADGLVTVNQPREQLARVVDAFRAHGGADKPMYLQVHLSLAASTREALAIAHATWRTGALDPPLRWDAATPSHLDVAARFVRPEDMHETVRVSERMEEQLAWLAEDGELGFDRIYLHQVGPDQVRLLDALARRAP